MGKKIAKGVIWGVPVVILLFGLFFCIGNDKADSLTKNDKDRLKRKLNGKIPRPGLCRSGQEGSTGRREHHHGKNGDDETVGTIW